MPPIEMIASPVRDRISIPIPKKYRAYSFVVTLTPVAECASDRCRMVRRGAKPKVAEPVYTRVFTGRKLLVDPNITSTSELLDICEGEDRR